MATANPPSASSSDQPQSQQQSQRTASAFVVSKAEREAARSWDIFYKKNETRFFKDRHWTDREFAQDLRIAPSPSPSTSIPTSADEPKAAGEEDNEEDEGEDSAAAFAQCVLDGPSSSDVKGKRKAREPVLLEVGCGVGNMLYPLLAKYPTLKCHCCDFSARAVQFVKTHPSYDPRRVNAFVYDLCSQPPAPSLLEAVSQSAVGAGAEADAGAGTGAGAGPGAGLESIVAAPSPIGRPTMISMIFVLSAVPPQLHEHVMRNVVACLRGPRSRSRSRRPSSAGAEVEAEGEGEEDSGSDSDDEEPSGTILFRDYAYGDMAQLRFDAKNASLPSYHEPTLLSSSRAYYRRGADNTLAYFFRPAELAALADRVGLQGSVEIRERVGENRKNGTVLKRVFLQARWTLKPSAPAGDAAADASS